MHRSVLLCALLSVAALSACQKPAPMPAAVVIQPVPGPAGPAGSTGMPGVDGSKGEAGKPGDGTVVIVTPPAPASAPSN